MNAAERITVILLLIAGAMAPAIAQEEEGPVDAVWDFSGYFKSLLIRGSSFFEEDYTLSLHRLRMQISAHPTREWEILAILDNQVMVGDYLETAEWALARGFERSDYLDLTLDPVDNTSGRWRVEPYRLHVRYFGENFDLSAGRQRIAWGSGRIWNPTDLFNPVSPLAIESGEKRGTDGIHMLVRAGENLTIETAGAIGIDSADVRLGVRLGTTVGSYDLRLVAGRFREQAVLGFDFSGYLGDSGFRGEFTHTWDDDREFLRAVFSFEHMLPGGINLLVEYLYNGGAIGNPGAIDLADFARYDAITTLNRHFLAAQSSLELHPLVSFGALVIADLADGSFFVAPALTWSVAQNVDLLFGVQIFAGDEGEFARYHHTGYVSLAWYFD